MGAPNRAVFSATLLEMAKEDANIIAMVSDSRFGGPEGFGETVPDQLVEVGIAEQNLVGISAGLAKSGSRLCVFACVFPEHAFHRTS